MKKILAVFAFVMVLAGVGAALAQQTPTAPAAVTTTASVPAATIPERSVGDAKAPVVVQEFVSLTCPHCAQFYKTIFPQIEERYIKTGKVRVILRDFPSDGPGLEAAVLARCMPEDEYFPFIKVLYNNQATWASSETPEQFLVQYAKLGGLGEDKAKACLKDTKMQDALVALRNELETKYAITATPELVFNDGVEKMAGVESIEAFAAIADKLLASTDKH